MGWQTYALSLAAGLCVDALYGLLYLRSPAPPVIALLGLLGMLMGEMAMSYPRARVSAETAAAQSLHGKTFVVTPSDHEVTRS